jgi:hypothetical protein
MFENKAIEELELAAECCHPRKLESREVQI